jgi:hypothetical protein
MVGSHRIVLLAIAIAAGLLDVFGIVVFDGNRFTMLSTMVGFL